MMLYLRLLAGLIELEIELVLAPRTAQSDRWGRWKLIPWDRTP